MNPGPAPTLVADWFTWGFVLLTVAFAACLWLYPYILTPKQRVEPDAVSFPVSPCAPRGHYYRAQPIVWRCVECGDERVADGVYDQNYTA